MFDKVEKTVGIDFEDNKFIGFLDYIEKMNDFQVLSSVYYSLLKPARKAYMSLRTKMRS